MGWTPLPCTIVAIPEHVRVLRQKVGTDLLQLASAATVTVDADGRVLLVRLAGTGRWALPGGIVDIDEHPADAAARETLEEAGVEVEITDLLTAVGGPEHRVRYPHGDEVSYVSVVYRARPIGGEARPDGEETSEVGWFARPELPLDELGTFAHEVLGELGWLERALDDPAPSA